MFDTVVVACDNCRRPLVTLEWSRAGFAAAHARPALPNVPVQQPDGLTIVRSRNRWSRKIRDMGGGRLRLECDGKRCRFTKDAPQAWLDAAFRLAQGVPLQPDGAVPHGSGAGRRKVFCGEVDQALKAVS